MIVKHVQVSVERVCLQKRFLTENMETRGGVCDVKDEETNDGRTKLWPSVDGTGHRTLLTFEVTR